MSNVMRHMKQWRLCRVGVWFGRPQWVVSACVVRHALRLYVWLQIMHLKADWCLW